MTAMNMQALAVTNFFTDLTKNTVRRKRPDGAHCTDEATCNVQDRSASFFSGHTSMSFTAAGLTCAHHGAVDLYGGGAGDTIACVAAVSLASLTGVMRIAADRHHTTDVMLGAGFGFGVGYFLPSVFHYWNETTAEFLPQDSFLVPLAEQNAMGLALVGVW